MADGSMRRAAVVAAAGAMLLTVLPAAASAQGTPSVAADRGPATGVSDDGGLEASAAVEEVVDTVDEASGGLLWRLRDRATELLPGGSSAVTVASGSGVPLRSGVRSTSDPRPAVVLRGAGWGHSVGLSQYGAYAQARQGRSVSQILRHYYPTTTLGTESENQRVTVTLHGSSLRATDVTALRGSVSWRVCQPNGGSCEQVTQPRDTTWRVRVSEDRQANPTRVALFDAAGQLQGRTDGGTIWVQLTDRDAFDASASRSDLRMTDLARGTQTYAYGRFTFSTVSGDLRVVNELPMEGYLRGIREVPAGWGGSSGGQAALQAQAIIARTYVLSRSPSRVTCATPACQVFAGVATEREAAGQNWVDAVRSTRGQVVRDARGALAETFYSSSHGGRTEASEDSWAYGSSRDYLRSVDDPWSLDAANPLRSWTTTVPQSEFRRVTGAGMDVVERVRITSRTDGGSPRAIEVSGRRDGEPRTITFDTTPEGARSARGCNRAGYAGNSLRCDLQGVTTIDATGRDFTSGAGGQPPSSQIGSVGFGPFTDDDGTVHEYATVFAHQAGIAQGIGGDRFAPGRAVTRGQMARFLFQTFEVAETSEHDFDDVRGSEHETAIASVVRAGIARGVSASRFEPNEPVTRAQMATFLVNAMGLQPRDPQFSDVSADSTHGRNIGALAHAEVTGGCGGDRFCPSDPVQRGQMASFVYRAVQALR